MSRLWREHRLLLLAFAAAVALTLFFAGRFVAFTLYWADPAHHEQRIEGWMTAGYIARSWHVPRELVEQAAGLPPQHGPVTLDAFAAESGRPLPEITAAVEAAIAAAKDTAGR